MTLITWTDDFSVRVDKIDEQHQKIVGIINELHNTMLEGKGNKIISDILDQLAEYAVYHFETEEKYFKELNYPQAEQHTAAHNDFVKKVSLFMEDYRNGDVMLTIDVLGFLSDWLQNHILGEDMEYSDFFLDQGLK